MRKNKNGKPNARTLLETAGLLSCLLAFSLLGSLLPTALSIEMSSAVIGSSGAITYSRNATLLVTDSTPEGPVPYKIDGNSGYQTGSTYSLSARAYTIELPSPYTSPTSSVTYYFSYWQDGPTDNPRTVSLEATDAVNLHGIYSTSPEPPPPPPPPPDMPSDYLAYTGFESPTTTSQIWEEGSVSTGWAGSGVNRIIDSDRFAGTRCLELYKAGGVQRNVLTLYPDARWGVTAYTSGWYKIVEYTAFSWSAPWVFRNNYGSRSEEVIFVGISRPGGSASQEHWLVGHSHGPGAPDRIDYWGARIYEGSGYTFGTGPYDSISCATDGHEVPRGRWFRLEVYMHRDYSNGAFKVWITDPQNPDPQKTDRRVLFSVDGARTNDDFVVGSGGSNYVCPFTKLYGGGVGGGYSLTARLRVDELYIWNTLPSSASDTVN